jgi:hypothetical protein
MATSKKQGLPQVAVAVRRRRLARCHIDQLRARIAQAQEIDTDHWFARITLRNLRIADTQLREIAARSDGSVFDERALKELPDGVRQRILRRLERVAWRLAAARSRAMEEEARDPAFRCVREYVRCREEARSARFWCHIAMVVCLAGSMLRR